MNTSPQTRRQHMVAPLLFPADVPSRFILWLSAVPGVFSLVQMIGGSDDLCLCPVSDDSNTEVIR